MMGECDRPDHQVCRPPPEGDQFYGSSIVVTGGDWTRGWGMVLRGCLFGCDANAWGAKSEYWLREMIRSLATRESLRIYRHSSARTNLHIVNAEIQSRELKEHQISLPNTIRSPQTSKVGPSRIWFDRVLQPGGTCGRSCGVRDRGSPGGFLADVLAVLEILRAPVSDRARSRQAWRRGCVRTMDLIRRTMDRSGDLIWWQWIVHLIRTGEHLMRRKS